MWYGVIMSNEEISEKYKRVWSKFDDDKRETIPRIELTTAISEEFEIPDNVAEAYVTIALTYYSSDWYNILDNVVRLIKTEMCHSVYETVSACGDEPTSENAKKEVAKLKDYITKRNEKENS